MAREVSLAGSEKREVSLVWSVGYRSDKHSITTVLVIVEFFGIIIAVSPYAP